MTTTLHEPKINVHEAVRAAVDFFEETFAHEKTSHLQLEEIELSEDGRFWLVTVGYDDPVALEDDLIKASALLRRRPLRKYKIVRVDAQTGRAVAVKIRQ